MSGTALKFLMMFLMVLDHIDYFVPHELWLVFHVASRPVGAFFAYMCVEGFMHTRSRPRYISRMFLWAAVMAFGSFLLNEVIIKDERYYIGNNIFLTFAISLFILYILEDARQNKNGGQRAFLCVVTIFLFIFAFLRTEGGFFIPQLILITYYCRDNKKLRNVLYAVLSLFVLLLELYISSVSGPGNFGALGNVNFLFIIFLPFTYLYNGKRGLNNAFTKYAFYVFYPLHIWLIALLAWKLV